MGNRAILKSCLHLFFLSIATAFIGSCAHQMPDRYPEPEAQPPLEAAAESPGPPPTGHVWQYLFSYGDEDDGYATYSYVLVGRDESNEDATSLYFELVKAIQGSTFEAVKMPEDAPMGRFNLFLIPAKGPMGVTSHRPNYELSKLLLSALSTVSSLKFSNPGPYIITLYQPISFGRQGDVADVLYMDLTNMHPVAIPEVVRTYKNKILDENLSGIEKLRSLRLSILNIALITEDSIGFARAAYAELRRAFGE